MAHAKDPAHWLYRFTPREWIQTALAEVGRAELAFKNGERKGALATCRRAAGMAVNGMLASAETPEERFGRSFMDHLIALAADDHVPEAVRNAARLLVETPLPGAPVVALRTGAGDERLLEAARVVMSHAYAMVLKSEPIET